MGTPARFVDDAGVTRLEGSLFGGGGSVPLANTYYGNSVSINNGANAPLPVNFPSAQGAALLDLTTPTAPKFITAGAYIVSALVQTGDAMTAGGFALLHLAFPDSTLTDLPPFVDFDGQATTADAQPNMSASMPYLAAAGDSIVATVNNLDGVQAIHFLIACLSVVKV